HSIGLRLMLRRNSNIDFLRLSFLPWTTKTARGSVALMLCCLPSPDAAAVAFVALEARVREGCDIRRGRIPSDQWLQPPVGRLAGAGTVPSKIPTSRAWGQRAVPSTLMARWRWGPVLLPVEALSMRYWPTVTRSPVATAWVPGLPWQ